MTVTLTKEGDSRPSPTVIKKTAAIFLSIALTVIGSISTAQAGESVKPEMIAATPVLSIPPFSTNKAIDILGLPRMVPTELPQLEMPKLENNLAGKWEPSSILHEDETRIPTLTGLVTSAFGFRKHPIKGKVRHHDGIDLAAKLGTPVFAPAPGRVIFAGTRTGYGNVVEIDHQNGYSTLLAHHSAVLVKAGDWVNPSTMIARAGRTGWATGVHVHVEVRKHGSLVNPIAYLSK
jgi:murein DD-endopeptidase MepM/ murein hydrolase activator NlpD